MFGWIVLGVLAALITTGLLIDRNRRVKKIEEQVEYNDNRSNAIGEASRYNDMNNHGGF
ncbi:hypothetical protein LCM20_15895 [Halobacillus litoralis]|uniref:hypothetical protein n=1 Tax=Halobacillus litoralis TaxID=45668 RepID=UPI001CD4647B|nr:hypothetical protein [Halobacillus litoralis]MCA0972090.1 hypothetical protein [Halobacillus litoralis]